MLAALIKVGVMKCWSANPESQVGKPLRPALFEQNCVETYLTIRRMNKSNAYHFSGTNEHKNSSVQTITNAGLRPGIRFENMGFHSSPNSIIQTYNPVRNPKNKIDKL